MQEPNDAPDPVELATSDQFFITLTRTERNALAALVSYALTCMGAAVDESKHGDVIRGGLGLMVIAAAPEIPDFFKTDFDHIAEWAESVIKSLAAH